MQDFSRATSRNYQYRPKLTTYDQFSYYFFLTAMTLTRYNCCGCEQAKLRASNPPKRLRIAYALTICFNDVICKLASLLRTVAKTNGTDAYDSVCPTVYLPPTKLKHNMSKQRGQHFVSQTSNIFHPLGRM